VAAEERRVVGSINGLLDALLREKEALLLSFNAQQVLPTPVLLHHAEILLHSSSCISHASKVTVPCLSARYN